MIYYNEWDAFAAAGLRELYPSAFVDKTSIKLLNRTDYGPFPFGVPVDVDLSPYNQVHFFAGIGGWSEALRLARWPADRPIWTGSCPCQPFSDAGQKKGTADERHLWPDMFRQVRKYQPREIVGEQVASLDALRWLDGVFADLEGEGYTCGAVDLPAAGAGAPIKRQRLFWGARREAVSSVPVSESGCPSSRGNTRSIPSTQAGECGTRERHGDLLDRSSDGRADVRSLPESAGPRFEGREDSRASRRDAGQGGGSLESERGDSSRPAMGLADDAGCLHNAWADYDLCWFHDDRNPGAYIARRIEPGTLPVAYGIPAGHAAVLPRLVELGIDPAAAKRIIALARTHRVGTIRGYGNAICPQTAALFLRAWLEEFPN